MNTNYSLMVETFSYSGWIVIEWEQYWNYNDAYTALVNMTESWNKQINRVWITESGNEHKRSFIPTMARRNIAHRQAQG